MCDALSLASAGGDVLAGYAGAIDAKSVASFESGMMDVMKVLGSARTSSEIAGLTKSYTEQMEMNFAAMAMSGVAFGSFDSVNEGNLADMQDNIKILLRNNGMEASSLDTQAAMARLDGKMKAAASMFSGFASAADTIYAAEESYQKSHTGQTRLESIKQSLGWA